MVETVLETNGLTKSYGALKAVNNFTIKLESNKIYGLLGRNGAGKTTFLDVPGRIRITINKKETVLKNP